MNNYISYDYKELIIHSDLDLQRLDALECLGWEIDESKSVKQEKYIFKRPRHIVDKMELIRLERNLESCFDEIVQLEKSVQSHAIIVALTVGVIGTVFMACSTFAVVHEPPYIMLCVLFAIPGFIGWILPCILYKKTQVKRRQEIIPFIENKYDEIDKICYKAMQLRSL